MSTVAFESVFDKDLHYFTNWANEAAEVPVHAGMVTTYTWPV